MQTDPKLGLKKELETGPEIKFGGGGKDPIGDSIKLRKSQPGESVTNTVPNKDKNQNDLVFQLSLKGEGPKILMR